jgi:LPS-assembly protein
LEFGLGKDHPEGFLEAPQAPGNAAFRKRSAIFRIPLCPVSTFAPGVIRPLVPLLLAFAAASASGAPGDAGVVTTGENVTTVPQSGEEILKGNASIQDGDTLLTADEIDYFTPTETIVAIGHVVLTNAAPGNKGMRLLADSLTYRRADGSFSAQHVRVGQHPFFVSGEAAQGTVHRVEVYHAIATYNEPGRWKPTIKADSLIFMPGHFIRLGQSRIGVAGLPMLPLWHVAKTIDQSAALSYIGFSGGYRSSLGLIGNASLRIPVTDGVRVGADLSTYTSRGVMFGPAASYRVTEGDSDWQGTLKSGFIEDYGHRLTDILGDPVPKSRGFIDWQQQAQVTDDITLDGQFSWWKDSEVLRDFRPKEFYAIQEPDSYVEAVDTGENSFASAFVRMQPDSYEPVQERLPELSYDLLPTAIGGGFDERFNADAVSLLERPPGGGQELASDRLDLFYGINRPITDGDWLSFTPVVGGRLTNYSGTEGAADPGGTTRALGEVGFDAMLKTSGTFDYRNPRWDIDGLRHLFDPVISYRYIPAATQGQASIPEIDRLSFDPDLQPLELGDIRYIDQLQPTNTLRFGFDNTLQTRDSGYGSRDLATFDITDDLLFTRPAGEHDFSQIHTDLGFSPEPWLTLTSAEIFSPETMGVHEVETGFRINDGNAWSLNLGSDFLRHEDDAYLAEYRVRLNEVWAVRLLAEYDARQGIFPQRAVVLEQNLVNTWAIQYIATYSSGPNPTGHFGFNVQIELLQF